MGGEAGLVSALVLGAGCAVLAFPAFWAWTPMDNCHTATANDRANKPMVTKRRDDLTFMAHSQRKGFSRRAKNTAMCAKSEALPEGGPTPALNSLSFAFTRMRQAGSPFALLLPGGSPFDVFSLPDTIAPALI